jgi:hypothetical protein
MSQASEETEVIGHFQCTCFVQSDIYTYICQVASMRYSEERMDKFISKRM